MEERYNHLNKYLKEKFGERVLKICIDGGFTCPNRDGSKGSRGCVFCSERGSGEHLRNISIEAQVKNHLASYRNIMLLLNLVFKHQMMKLVSL